MSPESLSSSYNFSIVLRRWGATWIDFLLFLSTAGLVIKLLVPLSIVFWWLWIAGFLAYYPLCEGLTGKTLGKLLCRILVVDSRGKIPGMKKALLRTLARLIEANPFLMGGIPAGIIVLLSKTKQRLGDMGAETFVLCTKDLSKLDEASS